MTLYSIVSGSTYGHYECGPTDTLLEVMSTADGAASSIFLGSDSDVFETETESPTGGFFSLTDEPSLTGSAERPSSGSPFSFSLASQSTTAGSDAPSGTASAANVVTSTVTTGAAMRTADAMLGAAGGVAGMLAFLV